MPSNALTNTVWLNDGAGSFGPHPTTPNFEANSSVATALGDLDDDGDLDAVISDFGQLGTTVWLNGVPGYQVMRNHQ